MGFPGTRYDFDLDFAVGDARRQQMQISTAIPGADMCVQIIQVHSRDALWCGESIPSARIGIAQFHQPLAHIFRRAPDGVGRK